MNKSDTICPTCGFERMRALNRTAMYCTDRFHDEWPVKRMTIAEIKEAYPATPAPDTQPRICANCEHPENGHKWYGQAPEYNDEERWECRVNDCDCVVTWSDHEWVIPDTQPGIHHTPEGDLDTSNWFPITLQLEDDTQPGDELSITVELIYRDMLSREDAYRTLESLIARERQAAYTQGRRDELELIREVCTTRYANESTEAWARRVAAEIEAFPALQEKPKD